MNKTNIRFLTKKEEPGIKTKTKLLEALVTIITREEPRLRLDPVTSVAIANKILSETKNGDDQKSFLTNTTKIIMYETSLPENRSEKLAYTLLEYFRTFPIKEIKPVVVEELEQKEEVPGMGDVMENAEMVSDIINIVQDELMPNVPITKIRLAVAKIIARVRKG